MAVEPSDVNDDGGVVSIINPTLENSVVMMYSIIKASY